MRKQYSLFAVLALSGLAVSAQAQITMTTSNRISGGYGINFSYNGVNGSTSYAGPFATTLAGPGIGPNNFDAYCVDLGHYLQPVESVTPQNIKTALPTSGAQIAYLYNTFAAGVGTDATKGAALQIAIWEVEYDYGVNGLDLNAGNFRFTSVANDPTGHPNYDNILNLLTNVGHTGYLDNIPVTYNGTLNYLAATHPTSTTGQSLIGPANVPEPGMVSLMASSMAGLSAFAIRRRRKA